ncbi:MAG TPA: cyclic nucleotide-binding domain-containing protein [Nocardioides sp.]|nr:cyclic nucleotide-binding domain-containing protein [Nocardioides sp.]
MDEQHSDYTDHRSDYRFASRDLRLAGLATPSHHRMHRAELHHFVDGLRLSPRLAGIGEHELRVLARECHWFSYPPRWAVMAEASHDDVCFLVTEGSLHLQHDGELTGTAGPGDILGLCALTGCSAPTTVVTDTRVRGIAIPAGALRRVLSPAEHAPAVTHPVRVAEEPVPAAR